MRAVITGGQGFVGRHLHAALEADGHEVVALDRNDVDVADPDDVLAAFTAARGEVVFHLAALSHVGESWNDPGAVERVNVGGTVAVIEAAAATGATAVVVVGSAEEYGRVRPDEVPLREDHPLAPESPYGRSKAEATRRAIELAATTSTRIVIARPFNHTGPGQAPKFLIPALAARIRAAAASCATSIAVGNLDPVRDIGDVRDVVRAYRLLAEHGESGLVYNVCTGRGVSVREIAERLVAASGRALALEVDPELVRPVDVPVLVGDHTRLTAATGWEPRIDLDTTLRDVLAAAG